MDELKPCPFCGGEADTFEHFDYGESSSVIHWYDVGCSTKDCICEYGTDHALSSEQEAIKAWNTRADSCKGCKWLDNPNSPIICRDECARTKVDYYTRR